MGLFQVDIRQSMNSKDSYIILCLITTCLGALLPLKLHALRIVVGLCKGFQNRSALDACA